MAAPQPGPVVRFFQSWKLQVGMAVLWGALAVNALFEFLADHGSGEMISFVLGCLLVVLSVVSAVLRRRESRKAESRKALLVDETET
jgi:glucose uptake protein GlcU